MNNQSQQTLELLVNGQPTSLPMGTSVEEFLRRHVGPGRPLAVELNGELLRGDQRQRPLAHGDVLEIVTLVGGG